MPRKVAVIIPALRGWAVDRLYQPLMALSGVDIVYTDSETFRRGNYDKYDLVHAAYFANVAGSDIPARKTILTVHHIEPAHLARIRDALSSRGYENIITSNPQTFCELTSVGIPCHFIPYWIPSHLSMERHDGVGIMGMSWGMKRHDAVREACRIAGVRLIEQTRDPADHSEPTLPLDDFYGLIGCYVNAAYVEGGPLPAMDALARSIPVVSTPSGSIPMYLREGVNGYYTDGTPEDIARQIDRAMMLPTFDPPRFPTLDEWLAQHDEVYDACEG